MWCIPIEFLNNMVCDQHHNVLSDKYDETLFLSSDEIFSQIEICSDYLDAAENKDVQNGSNVKILKKVAISVVWNYEKSYILFVHPR